LRELDKVRRLIRIGSGEERDFDPQGKKRGGTAPLRPPTLASFRTWGIQQELVVPPVTKVKQILGIAISHTQNEPRDQKIKR